MKRSDHDLIRRIAERGKAYAEHVLGVSPMVDSWVHLLDELERIEVEDE